MTSSSSIVYRPRSVARLGAVQALYQQEHTSVPIVNIIQDFMKRGVILDEAHIEINDHDLFSQLAEGVNAHQEMIDQYICERLAEGWRLERLDSVIRAILRCGVYEIMTFNHIDVPVIISEYMTIASGFVDARQSAFVNGLLDNVARSIRGGTREDVKSEPV